MAAPHPEVNAEWDAFGTQVEAAIAAANATHHIESNTTERSVRRARRQGLEDRARHARGPGYSAEVSAWTWRAHRLREGARELDRKGREDTRAVPEVREEDAVAVVLKGPGEGEGC